MGTEKKRNIEENKSDQSFWHWLHSLSVQCRLACLQHNCGELFLADNPSSIRVIHIVIITTATTTSLSLHSDAHIVVIARHVFDSDFPFIEFIIVITMRTTCARALVPRIYTFCARTQYNVIHHVFFLLYFCLLFFYGAYLVQFVGLKFARVAEPFDFFFFVVVSPVHRK